MISPMRWMQAELIARPNRMITVDCRNLHQFKIHMAARKKDVL